MTRPLHWLDPLHWLEVTLEAPSDGIEAVENALLETGAQAVTLQGADGPPILEPAPGEAPLWQRMYVTGLFAPRTDSTQTLEHLTAQLGGRAKSVQSRLVEDRDWVRAWLDHYHPMQFGHRLWVCPSGRHPPHDATGTVIVNLDPGLAFGTGTHPSTALCLEWLDGATLENTQVIDYGCGSGILGIAALKLGAAEAWSVDIDEQALRATADNAQRNGVAARVRAQPAHHLPPMSANVILANILAAPLIALAPLLATRACRGGWIVLSGILDRQAESVAAAYKPWFDMEQPASREGWSRLTGRRT